MTSERDKLRPEVKAKWLAALRSGAYQQGKGRLRTKDRFCCLGVLCDVAVAEGVTTAEPDGFDGGVWSYDGGGSISMPPNDVVRWAYGQLPNDAWWVRRERDDRHLPALNDNGATFAEIAALIEESL